MSNDKESVSTLIKKILKTIALSSTSHGLPNIVRSDKISLKIMWTFLFVLSSAYCFYSILKSINLFLEYPTVTSANVLDDIPSMFPAISFCNLNYLTTKLAFDESRRQETAYNLSNFVNSSSIQELYNYAAKVAKLFHSNILSPYFTDKYRKSLSVSLEYMLLFCQFALNDCNASDFDSFYDPTYGNCFTFNSGKRKILESTESGIINGLKLLLYIEDSSKTLPFIFSAGIHLFVHNQTLASKPRTSKGIDISSGTQTNVNIKREFDVDLPSPYSDCKSKLDSADSFDSIYFKTIINSGQIYTQDDCLDLCLQGAIVKYCNCYSTFMDSLNFSTPCITLEQINCIIKISKTFKSFDFTQKCSPYCPRKCETASYSISISFADFPNPMMLNTIKHKLSLKYSLADPTNEQLKNSLVYVNVYYDELKFTQTTHTPLMTFIDFLSNIGGTLGLFIGISFLSFAEILEALFEIIFILFERRKNLVSFNN